MVPGTCINIPPQPLKASGVLGCELTAKAELKAGMLEVQQ